MEIKTVTFNAYCIRIEYKNGTETEIHFLFSKTLDEMRALFWDFVHENDLDHKIG